jgi:hypothetical protein
MTTPDLRRRAGGGPAGLCASRPSRPRNPAPAAPNRALSACDLGVTRAALQASDQDFCTRSGTLNPAAFR